MVNESRIHISNADAMNSRIRDMAIRYFEASENAEKYIYNYQELKLNVELSIEERKQMRLDALKSVSIAKEKGEVYNGSLEGANNYIDDFIK